MLIVDANTVNADIGVAYEKRGLAWPAWRYRDDKDATLALNGSFKLFHDCPLSACHCRPF